jgi:hypothetical protein
VPLVSGVCRTASAPKLSHGGSRLNASKPEASPKTRCPQTQNTHHTTVSTQEEYHARRGGKDSMDGCNNKHNTLHIESPLKKPRALLASMAQSIPQIHKTTTTPSHSTAIWAFSHQIPPGSEIRRQPNTTTPKLRPSPNERTCMGWHERHAPLRWGSRGILRPEALNLEAWNFTGCNGCNDCRYQFCSKCSTPRYSDGG